MQYKIIKVALEAIGASEQGSEAYEQATKALNLSMSASTREQLAQLVHMGPVEDGM
jgi:hypothetical protein